MLTFQTPAARTALIHYSLDLLPEKSRWRPRYRDDRVGFFRLVVHDLRPRRRERVSLTYIDRFRLEKKDRAPSYRPGEPDHLLSQQRDIQSKWKPMAQEAVENWNVAFARLVSPTRSSASSTVGQGGSELEC